SSSDSIASARIWELMASTSSSDGGLAAHDSMIRVVKFFATITQGSASLPAPLLVVKNGLMLESGLVVLVSVGRATVDCVRLVVLARETTFVARRTAMPVVGALK
ncbi:MAG: hypothetical protein ABGY24_06100, partial [bacterium]